LRIAKARIIKAIPGSGGVISRITKSAGYKSWTAVRDFIQADPGLISMRRDEQEGIDDLAESGLIAAMTKGDTEIMKWWLARKRAEFNDKQSLGLTGAVTLNVVYQDKSKIE